MPKGYDSRCEDLGRIFLGDEPELLTDANAAELAQEIQDVIEDFITSRQSLAQGVRQNAAAGETETTSTTGYPMRDTDW